MQQSSLIPIIVKKKFQDGEGLINSQDQYNQDYVSEIIKKPELSAEDQKDWDEKVAKWNFARYNKNNFSTKSYLRKWGEVCDNEFDPM